MLSHEVNWSSHVPGIVSQVYGPLPVGPLAEPPSAKTLGLPVATAPPCKLTGFEIGSPIRPQGSLLIKTVDDPDTRYPPSDQESPARWMAKVLANTLGEADTAVAPPVAESPNRHTCGIVPIYIMISRLAGQTLAGMGQVFVLAEGLARWC